MISKLLAHKRRKHTEAGKGDWNNSRGEGELEGELLQLEAPELLQNLQVESELLLLQVVLPRRRMQSALCLTAWRCVLIRRCGVQGMLAHGLASALNAKNRVLQPS
jgi:hypothetical protein